MSTDRNYGEMVFRNKGEETELFLTMGRHRLPENANHRQVDRPVHTELFSQGTTDKQGADAFMQTATPSGLLDILVVVDDSGSMHQEQVNLSSKLSKLLSFVSGSDWRIAVTTTDPDRGCQRAVISKNDPDPGSAFAAAIQAGTDGSGLERGVEQAIRGLQCNGGNWVREGSTIAVLLVSDEDNCSDGTKCTGTDYDTASDLTNYLDGIRELGVNSRVYGIISHPDQACSTALRPAPIYAAAVQESGGTWGSICDSDYSATLEAISRNIGTILESQFALSRQPIENSVRVYVNDVLIGDGYTLTGRIIAFDEAPADGSRIRVDYEYQENPPRKTFVLSRPADGGTLEMFIDGKPAAGGSWTLDKLNAVTFKEAPVGMEVKAVFREPGELNLEFPLVSKPVTGSVRVKVNGENPGKGAWELDGQKVVFAEGPSDGASVVISYQVAGGPQYDYPLFVPGAHHNSLVAYDKETGKPVEFTTKKGLISFSREEYSEGRVVVLRWLNADPVSWSIDTNQILITDEPITATAGSGRTCSSSDKLKTNGQDIDLTACGFSNEDLITLEFTYHIEQQLSFTIDDSRLGNGDGLVWTILLDGKETSSLNRTGTTISFDSLENGTRVTVRVGVPGES